MVGGDLTILSDTISRSGGVAGNSESDDDPTIDIKDCLLIIYFPTNDCALPLKLRCFRRCLELAATFKYESL